MDSIEIISLVITIVCVVSFSAVFTILFRNYYKNNIEKIVEGKDDIDLIDNAIYQDQKDKNKVNKILKVTGKVASWVILGIVVAFFGLSLYGRFTGNTMIFGDRNVIVIGSDSMSEKNKENSYLQSDDPKVNNQFNTYDIIGIQKYKNEEDVKLYDVIAYKANDGRTIVHRIIKIELDAETNEYHYQTRGDKNAASDTRSLYGDYLTYNDLIGFYNNFKIPALGIFVIFLQSNAGIITVLSVIYCFLMYDHFNSKYQKAIDERTELLIDLLQYDVANASSAEESGIASHYKQTIYYQGNEYAFENGKYISKTVRESNEDESTKVDDENIVFIKEENDKKTIEVTNVKSKETKKYEDVKEEDAKKPLSFLAKLLKPKKDDFLEETNEKSNKESNEKNDSKIKQKNVIDDDDLD